jgi:hypothetical protein
VHHPDVLHDLARAEIHDRLIDAALRNRRVEGRRRRYRTSPRRRASDV